MTLFNADAGFAHVKKVLHDKGYAIRMVDLVRLKGCGQHLVVQAEKDNVRQFFYCIYKREYVHSFNNYFPQFVKDNPEMAGFGESINTLSVDYARMRDSIILYVYPDSSIYAIYANIVYRFCSNNMLVHVQNRENSHKTAYGYGQIEIVQEREYWFPISLLERFY